MTEESKILYHYTSMNTLLKILQDVEKNSKVTLRGTHIEFLNDKAEFSTAVKIIIDAVAEYEKINSANVTNKLTHKLDEEIMKRLTNFEAKAPFVTCFSEDPDSLPMWTHYADNGQGVALGIKYIDDWEPISDHANLAWGLCTYDNEKLLGELKQTFIPNLFKNIEIFDNRGIYSKGDYTDLSKCLCIVKHPGFAYEKEIRLIKLCATKKSNYKISPYEIKLRENKGLLIPFIEHHLPKEILQEIHIGPCVDFDLSKKSLEMCLLRSGYSVRKRDNNYVKIKKSTVPYRLI